MQVFRHGTERVGVSTLIFWPMLIHVTHVLPFCMAYRLYLFRFPVYLLYLSQQAGDFKRIGILVGMSLVQGGSGFPFFAPAMYDYMCGKDVCSLVPTVDEIPDAQLKITLVEVCICI